MLPGVILPENGGMDFTSLEKDQLCAVNVAKNMYVCLYVCVCVCVRMRVCVHTYTHTHTHTRTRTHTHAHTLCMYICM